MSSVSAAIQKKSTPPAAYIPPPTDTPYIPPPPPPHFVTDAPSADVEAATQNLFEDADYRMMMNLLEKMRGENKAAERLIRRQDTAIGTLMKIMKTRAPSALPTRVVAPTAVKKCTNCQRVNRRTTLCGPRAGKACTYCTDRGISCEGPAVDGRSLRKIVVQRAGEGGSVAPTHFS